MIVWILENAFVKLRGCQLFELSLLNLPDATRIYMKARRSIQMTLLSYSLFLSHSVACTLSHTHTPTHPHPHVRVTGQSPSCEVTCGGNLQTQHTTRLKRQVWHENFDHSFTYRDTRHCCYNRAW
jgi:hypothetical protein